MNQIKIEKHFDEAERKILNAGTSALKEIARLLKGRLRSIINFSFKKRTGTLLKAVEDKNDFSDKNNKEILVGINKSAKHALWLYKGTGVRRQKNGKSVGRLHATNFMDNLLRENRDKVKNIMIKHLKF